MRDKAFRSEITALQTRLDELMKDEKNGHYHQHVNVVRKEMLAYTTKLLAEHAKSPEDTERKFADLKNSFEKFQKTLGALKAYDGIKNNPNVDMMLKEKARNAITNASVELDKSIKYSMPEKLAIGMRTFAGFALGVTWSAIMALTVVVPLTVGIMAALKEKTLSAAVIAFASKTLLTPAVFLAQNTHYAYDYGKRKQKEVDFDILPTNTESNPTNVFKRAIQINRSDSIKEKLQESKKAEQAETEQAPSPQRM